MCDFVTYCNLRDKVWSNNSLSVECLFLFPAEGSDERYLIKLELRQYTGIFDAYGGIVELSNHRMVDWCSFQIVESLNG